MKTPTFNEWLQERMRHRMPQFDNLDHLVDDLKKNDIKITNTKASAKDIYPTQDNFNDEKIQRIIDTNSFSKPVIVSKDDEIIDGHHRWAAAKKSDAQLNIMKVDLPTDQLFDFVDGKKYVSKRGINA